MRFGSDAAARVGGAPGGDEPQLGVLLPVPVGGELRQAAEAFLAIAQGAEGVRLHRSEADQPLELGPVEPVLAHQVVGAELEGGFAQSFVALPGQDQNQPVGRLQEAYERIQALGIGQVEIGNYEIDAAALEPSPGVAQRGHVLDRQAAPVHTLEVRAHEAGKYRVVLEQQDPYGGELAASL